MNNMLVRTLSGIVFVSIVLSSLILSEYSALAIILAVIAVSIFEFRRMFGHHNKVLFITILGIGIISTLLAYFTFSGQVAREVIPVFLIGSLTFLVVYYIIYDGPSTHDVGQMLFVGSWITASLILFYGIGWLETPGTYNPRLIVILMSLVWISDVGAYFFGSLFGRTPLAKSISPGKTVEGFLGGIILNAIAGYITYLIIQEYTPIFWIIIAMVVSLGASAGDLFESKMKREAGVKDSGKVIPGHGGILDRFDSLMFSAPLFYVIVIVWQGI